MKNSKLFKLFVLGALFWSICASSQTVQSQFVAVTPCRLVDTRNPVDPNNLGGPTMNASETRTMHLIASPCGLPSNASAYSLNITVVPSGSLGFLTIWPTGSPQPLVSTLNAPQGNVLANAAIVAAGTMGDVNVFVSNKTDVIIDINGYFTPDPTIGVVTFSATPVFDASHTNSFEMTLTGNVTASTLINLPADEFVVFEFIQDAIGGHTVVWPLNVLDHGVVSSKASAKCIQIFWSDGTNAVAVSGMFLI